MQWSFCYFRILSSCLSPLNPYIQLYKSKWVFLYKDLWLCLHSNSYYLKLVGWDNPVLSESLYYKGFCHISHRRTIRDIVKISALKTCSMTRFAHKLYEDWSLIIITWGWKVYKVDERWQGRVFLTNSIVAYTFYTSFTPLTIPWFRNLDFLSLSIVYVLVYLYCWWNVLIMISIFCWIVCIRKWNGVFSCFYFDVKKSTYDMFLS